jgi:hypothetical protein
MSPRSAQVTGAATTTATAARAASRTPPRRRPETRTAATSVHACNAIVARRIASELTTVICIRIEAMVRASTTP